MSSKPVTVPMIRRRKQSGERITMITAYDAPSGEIAEAAGIDILLVGDSLANVVLGYENTLSVTMEEMLHHVRAVTRTARRCLVVADMPFLSYHLGTKQAIANAGRFIKEAGAHAVKLEGGGSWQAEAIAAIVERQIPVMGHVGLTPQSLHRLGGYRVQGKTAAAVDRLVDEALAIESAGGFALVLEGMPSEAAREITAAVKIPTIGIGAGPHCDGQVLVFHDMLGLSPAPLPRFVKRYCDGRGLLLEAIQRYIREVKTGEFPQAQHCYPMANNHKPERGDGE